MRRFLAWLACGAGALLFWRRLRRRRPEVAPAPDPAEELRRKLDESRVPPATPEPEPAAAEPAGPDERRREVHDRARSAIDRMRGEPPPER
jgi:hypothetical protein